MNQFCQNCGKENVNSAAYCYACGSPLNPQPGVNNAMNQTAQPVSGGEQKSKLVAGLLGIFLGYLGVHNFYLGHTGKAVAQLLLTLVGWILCFTGPIIASIWGLIEGIMCFTGSIKDSDGRPLGD